MDDRLHAREVGAQVLPRQPLAFFRRRRRRRRVDGADRDSDFDDEGLFVALLRGERRSEGLCCPA